MYWRHIYQFDCFNFQAPSREDSEEVMNNSMWSFNCNAEGKPQNSSVVGQVSGRELQFSHAEGSIRSLM